jgi:glycosyltransferase involved in cell wall biosynthesis
MVSADAGPLDNVAVILPALNEAESLPRVLADLPAVGIVLVVDNGSQDGTADVARQHGARVVDEPQRGYGAACLRGLATLRRWIDEGSAAVEIVVFIDADYSDYPERLPQLVEPIRTDHADFVLGSRLSGVRERGAMPPQSVWGNRLACSLMRFLFREHYTDLGPFRAIRWTSLEQLAMEDTGFGWTIEMQIKAARQGLRIQEVPVPYRRRIGQSKISGTISGTFRAGGKILWTIARYGLTDRRTAGSSR